MKNKFLTTIIAGSLAATAHAGVLSKIKSWHPYVQVAYVPTWVSAKGTSKTQVASAGNPADRFVANSSTHLNDFSFGVGFDLPLNLQRTWLSRLDFDLDYVNMKGFKVSGTHTMTLLVPPVDFKYNFNYRTKMSMLLLDADLDVFQYKCFGFYAGAGVDFNWLQTSDFSETPLPGTTVVPSITFKTNNKTQWLYHLNIGVSAKLSNHFRAGVRDRFYPYIPVQTGSGSNDFVPIAALKHHLTMNQVTLFLDYVF